MAAKPPGIPPKAPAAPRAPMTTQPGVQAPRIPIAPPTPKVSVEEAARAATMARPHPPSTPPVADADWDQTEVTRPHEMMLSRDDVKAIVESATSAALMALRTGQDDMRQRLGRMED